MELSAMSVIGLFCLILLFAAFLFLRRIKRFINSLVSQDTFYFSIFTEISIPFKSIIGAPMKLSNSLKIEGDNIIFKSDFNEKRLNVNEMEEILFGRTFQGSIFRYNNFIAFLKTESVGRKVYFLYNKGPLIGRENVTKIINKLNGRIKIREINDTLMSPYFIQNHILEQSPQTLS